MDTPKVEIWWTDPPDAERGVYYDVRSPKPNAPVEGIILSDTIVGVVTYYLPPAGPGIPGRSQPCTGDPETCKGCLSGRDHAWKGYLPCWDVAQGRLFLAEITREAYLRCPRFEVFRGALRGKKLRLTRCGKANNSRVAADVVQLGGIHTGMPNSFNVKASLHRIWFGGDVPREGKLETA